MLSHSGLPSGASCGPATVLAAAGATAASGYPKTNLTVGYRVDAGWPVGDLARPLPWRYITGLAVDRSQRIWVLNALAPQVRRYTGSGTFLGAWGSEHFVNPHHITLDAEGAVWISDYGAHTVSKFAEHGQLLMTLGTPHEPGADATHFNRPTAAAVTPAGDVFVTDGYGNNRIVHFDRHGVFVKAWGELGVGPGELSQPHSISLDAGGLLYVGERNNCRLQIFDQAGRSLDEWRNLFNPWGTWITANDDVFVCGSSPKRWGTHSNLGNPPTDQLVMKLSTRGTVLELWTFPLADPDRPVPGTTDWVHAIAVDADGNLYLGDVADNSPAHRVQRFLRLPAEA